MSVNRAHNYECYPIDCDERIENCLVGDNGKDFVNEVTFAAIWKDSDWTVQLSKYPVLNTLPKIKVPYHYLGPKFSLRWRIEEDDRKQVGENGHKHGYNPHHVDSVVEFFWVFWASFKDLIQSEE